MKIEKYEEAKDLVKEIEKLETDLFSINRLLNESCSIGCQIKGSLRGVVFSKIEIEYKLPYNLHTSAEIKRILTEQEKINRKELKYLQTELDKL